MSMNNQPGKGIFYLLPIKMHGNLVKKTKTHRRIGAGYWQMTQIFVQEIV